MGAQEHGVPRASRWQQRIPRAAVTWAQPKQRAQPQPCFGRRSKGAEQERKGAEPKQERVALTRESGVGRRRACVTACVYAAAAACRARSKTPRRQRGQSRRRDNSEEARAPAPSKRSQTPHDPKYAMLYETIQLLREENPQLRRQLNDITTTLRTMVAERQRPRTPPPPPPPQREASLPRSMEVGHPPRRARRSKTTT